MGDRPVPGRGRPPGVGRCPKGARRTSAAMAVRAVESTAVLHEWRTPSPRRATCGRCGRGRMKEPLHRMRPGTGAKAQKGLNVSSQSSSPEQGGVHPLATMIVAEMVTDLHARYSVASGRVGGRVYHDLARVSE